MLEVGSFPDREASYQRPDRDDAGEADAAFNAAMDAERADWYATPWYDED